jgi:hypothetical protein
MMTADQPEHHDVRHAHDPSQGQVPLHEPGELLAITPRAETRHERVTSNENGAED